MLRTINLQIDTSSWAAPRTPPAAFLSSTASGNRDIAVLSALLMTAFLTRPPVSHGFELSDLWAFLRYGPAIDDTPDLRLRREWEAIDSHQKTILSDDFGMGFTALVLAELLDFRHFADTKHVLSSIDPTYRWFRHYPKRGPAKSPDFLVVDAAGGINVLECKGSQASDEALRTSMEEPGSTQKGNLDLLPGILSECIVAGLFIPQHSNPASANLRIRDPYPKDLLRRLREISRADLKTRIFQISLAKHFALLGLDAIANALADGRIFETNKLDIGDAAERRAIERLSSRDAVSIIEIPLPYGAATMNGRKIAKAVFEGSVNTDLYQTLAESADIQEDLLRICSVQPDNRWLWNEDASAASLITPCGFKLRIRYEDESASISANDSRNWLRSSR